MNKLLKKSLSTALLLLYFTTLVLPNIGRALAGNYISSVFLILPGPITTTQDFRISLWSDGRPDVGDITGGGAINGAADNYAGYQVVVTLTPDIHGRTKIAFGNLTGFPEVTTQNQFMMVEYKEDADPDTAYVIYDATYLGSAMERFPLIVNGPDIYQGIYTNNATTANIFTLDRDNVGAGANVDIVANQGSDLDGTLRYNATLNQWEISNNGGVFAAISTGAGGADDFESIYATDGDNTLTTSNGILTFDTGTNDFVVNSNDWNVTAAGDLDAASITSNGALTASGAVNFSGATSLRVREVANEATAVCTTVNEIVLDTTEDRFYVCTVTGTPGTWVPSAPEILDLAAVQARRTTTLLLTGSFVDMTFDATDLENDTATVEHDDTDTDRVLIKEDGIYQITYDYSVTLPTTVTGTGATAQIRVNDTTVLNGSVSDISLSANTEAIVQELSQTVMLSLLSGDFLSVQLSSTGDAPTVNADGVFTVTKMEGVKGDAGAAAGDSDTLDTLDSTQFLRSDTTDIFTSGTLTMDNGTTLAVAGAANIGDGTEDVFINSDDWTISSFGVVAGLTGLTSTGVIDFTAATSFSPHQGASDPLTCSEGQLFYNSTSNLLKTCTATDTWTGVGEAHDFEDIYANDGDNTLTTSNGNFTISTGTGDFIIDSNDWNVTAAGALDVTGITSTGTVDLTGATFRGPQGGADPATCTVGGLFYNTTSNLLKICTATNTWSPLLRTDTSQSFTAGTYTFNSGTTLTANGTINFTGGTSFRPPQASSDPGTCSVGQVFYNTTSNTLKVCTSTNVWTNGISANGADLLDGVDSTQFLRSDASDSFTSGTLTMDNGTTLTMNGVVNIGDGGDNVVINSNDWDISSAGVMSGFTGITSTGGINFTGASSFFTPQGAADPGTCSVGQQFYNTTANQLKLCTATDTWSGLGSTTGANYLSGYDTTNQAVSTANTFQTVTFDNPTSVADGWTYSAGDFTTPVTGLYLVSYNTLVGRTNNGDAVVTIRATRGGTEITGSVGAASPSRANAPVNISQSFLVNLTAADLLSFEVTSSAVAGSLGIFQNNLSGTTKPTMSVTITRMN